MSSSATLMLPPLTRGSSEKIKLGRPGGAQVLLHNGNAREARVPGDWTFVKRHEAASSLRSPSRASDSSPGCRQRQEPLAALWVGIPTICSLSPNTFPCVGGEGSCEKIENRLLPALSVRRSARSTQVERALRARFHLTIQRRDGSGLAQFNFFTASGPG